MNWWEWQEAIRDAEETIRQADRAASQMARLLVGRLRKVESCDALAALKKELQDYNIHTRSWRK